MDDERQITGTEMHQAEPEVGDPDVERPKIEGDPKDFERETKPLTEAQGGEEQPGVEGPSGLAADAEKRDREALREEVQQVASGERAFGQKD